MIEVKKEKNSNNYDSFYIKTEDGTFLISFQNNLDLYWDYLYNGNINEIPDEKEFTITKENILIYHLFDNLYNNVKCSESPYDKYNPRRLLKKNIINWHSDDSTYDEASKILIEKMDEKYKLTFVKSKDDEFYTTYSVRFRNSGSRYQPYHQHFMKMYNELINQNFDNNCHQIHMEEYLYEQKKMSLKRSTK